MLNIFRFRATAILFVFLSSAASFAFEEPLEVVLLSSIEISALKGPFNLVPVTLRSKDDCHIYGEAGLSPIDSRAFIRLKKKVCGIESKSIAGQIIGQDGYSGLKVKCLDYYASKKRSQVICMIGQVEPGRVATALIE